MVTGGLLALISLLGLNVGPLGLFVAKMLKYTFGIGAVVVPLVLLIVGLKYIMVKSSVAYSVKFWGLLLLYFMALAIYHHIKIPVGHEIMPESLVSGGGFAGGMMLFSLRKLLGVHGSIIVLSALMLCSLLMATTWSLAETLVSAKDKAVESLVSAREAIAASTETMFQESDETKRQPMFYDHQRDGKQEFVAVHVPENETVSSKADFTSVAELSEPAPLAMVRPATTDINPAYGLPPVSLLKKPNRPRLTKVPKEVADNARILEQTLDSFGVSAKVINTCQGPTVTRYELEPAPGVKVSKIVNLSDDLALKLASSGVRIEAPIPGKAAIGIEVPNKELSGVALREVLEADEFQRSSSGLTVALGKDIAGQPIVTDLAKMPHLLVAGATGSGKSVCINTLITSVLFKARPDEVKLVLIDPKMVELSNYNGIPHLLTPVVTDAKKAASALNWAVQEMERRYEVFATAGVRDISRYNELHPESRLPLVLIIIDELADLMMVAPVDVEDAICRLAQKARAAGLHLVLATQRPSVDVITGTIKANVPSRISFAVSSQVDSRTILDMAGAEKLLGKGDMLFYPVGASKPLRVQGAFIGDTEVEDLVNYIKEQAEPEYTDGITNVETGSAGKEESTHFEDDLLEEAVRMVLETGQASVSMLQRKFRIGYTRAARLIDTMEEMKIVGPNIGSKAREIIMNSEQVYARYFKK
ncbi:FtsK/SpoIIIE family DNA translocase [Sporomusa sp.]|uniref:FtsK/SpoIIIE family DNA translocase n=1 Tax=Sporomusa sp. TaxID=2078658 RepID=UPI002B8FA9CD|nr:DNA translocase FtsK 4TM domain-containing protein [Sporomusa sp.]HWR43094.1 DNA translocase FtsK 4TM domain-containing protein [Sporomusa sp.]